MLLIETENFMSGRNYTLEFKEETAKLVLEQGQRIVDVAKNLGISRKNIQRWVSNARNGNISEKQALSPEQEEVKKLRKENELLRMEREILKKAAAFFAKEIR